jgi:hypothetical protein
MLLPRIHQKLGIFDIGGFFIELKDYSKLHGQKILKTPKNPMKRTETRRKLLIHETGLFREVYSKIHMQFLFTDNDIYLLAWNPSGSEGFSSPALIFHEPIQFQFKITKY